MCGESENELVSVASRISGTLKPSKDGMAQERTLGVSRKIPLKTDLIPPDLLQKIPFGCLHQKSLDSVKAQVDIKSMSLTFRAPHLSFMALVPNFLL